MNSRSVVSITSALVCMLFAPAISQSAEDWVAVKDPAEVRALYADKTLKGTIQDGSTFVSHYTTDGRGLMIYKGQTTPRTWEVKGDQLCVTTASANDCYVYWRHRDKQNVIKGMNVAKGWTFEATVEDGIPKF